jgi:site-specific DNA recombinase
LAIVDKDLFEAAQQRKAERTHDAPQKQRKAKFLLSGLLKCGCCGGGLSMKDRDHGRVRVHCSTMREAGTCSNRKIFYLDEIEKAVLTGLKKHLKAPQLLKEFVKTYQEERERLAAEKVKRHGRSESKLAEVQRSLDRMWSDYETERVPVEVLGPRMKEAQAQKVALLAELEAQPEPEKIVGLHPAALRHYEKVIRQLHEVFGQGVTSENEEAAEKIRNLVAKAIVKPAGEGLTIELQGRLALLMGAPNVYPNMRIAASGGSVVAEEGLEPPTQGL